MTLARRAVRSVAGVGLLEIVYYVASLVLQIAFARLLTPEIFGELALAAAILTFVTMFGRWGVAEAIMQDNEHQEVLSTIFWLRAAFGVLTLLVLGAGSFAVQHFYGRPVAVALLILMLPKVMLILTAPLFAEVQRKFRLPHLGALKLLGLLVSAGIGLYLVTVGYGLFGLAIFYGLKDGVLAVGVVIIAPRYPSLSYDRRTATWFRGFAVEMFKSKSLLAVEGSGDDYLVGTLGTSAALGVYSVSWRLASAFRTIFQSSINKGVLPTFARLKGAEERSKRGMSFILRSQLYLAVPAYVFAALAAPELIRLTLGPKWTAAAPVFRILAVAGVLFPLLGTIRQFYYARGDSGTVLQIQKYYLVVMFVGMGALVPVYGASGAAVAIGAMNVVGLALLLRQLKRDIDLDVSGLLLPATIAGGVSLAVGASVNQTGMVDPIQSRLLTICIYGAVTAITFYPILYALDSERLRDDASVFKRALLE